jgi:hypothetical protein
MNLLPIRQTHLYGRRKPKKLEIQLANYRALAREFPDGPTNAMIRDMIEELERQLREFR